LVFLILEAFGLVKGAFVGSPRQVYRYPLIQNQVFDPTVCCSMPRKPIRHKSIKVVQSSASNRKKQTSESKDDVASFTDDEPSTSTQYALDPTSEQATHILQSTLGLSKAQHDKLTQLCHLIVKWNDSINLISRKDCTLDVVFGRHILPSLALLALDPFKSSEKRRVIDVGTGGGFPGLPLAIACGANYQFTLVDSVGKKLKVVQDMADELGLTNVQTHHARVEELIFEFPALHKNQYHVCVGRSVAALPRFATWIDGLMLPSSGQLVYIIGGDLEPHVLSRVDLDIPLENLLDCAGSSDKRALVMSEESVALIAAKNGRKAIANSARSNVKARIAASSDKPSQGRKQLSRGEWKKRGDKTQVFRDNFKRLEL